VGPDEAGALALAEGPVKYHPVLCDALTTTGTPRLGPWQVGSLTGAVASESVTEAREGGLSAVGNGAYRVQGQKPA
jgi:hypothetical protein